jgi:hypothetical protein
MRNTLEEFDRQFAVLRRNFTSGKHTYWWNQPYIRPQILTPPVALPFVEEDTKNEAGATEPDPDTLIVTGESLPI